MEQEINQPTTTPELLVKERQESHKEVNLDSAIAGLVKYGGFDIIDATIEKAGNLNPTKKAKKSIYLNESSVDERKSLKNRLEWWIDLLSNNTNISDMMTYCDEKSSAASTLLAENIALGLEATKDLEQAYRGVDLFLKNTGKDQVPNVNFVNASMESIQDLDNPIFSNHVQEEFNINYNRLDLRNSYSIMVLPGYLGKNSVINHWGKIANDHKVTMITDFRDMEDAVDVIEMFKEADHASADEHKSNVVMACNWLVGRSGYPELGIDDTLHVAPSTALAGKIYESKSSMAQIAAGLQHGKFQGVDGTAFPTKKTELSELEKIGLVPVTNEFGSVMAFSGKTLFNGDNVGLQNYSVVRTFDWVTKVLIDFLNRSAFENFNSTVQKNLQQKIAKFLEGIRGSGKLIKDFSIHELEQDRDNPNMVNVKINITPYFATKTFLLAMSGTNGEEGVNWETDVN